MEIQKKYIEKGKIRLYYYLGSSTAIFFLVILLSVTYSRSVNQEYQRKIDQLSTSITNEKKRFIKNAVERTIALIKSERHLIETMPSLQHLPKDQIEKFSKKRIGKHIRDIRLIDKNCYIWIHHIFNYEGGDKYAIRLIHPNLPHTEGTWLSTHMKVPSGDKPFEDELKGIREDGEVFFEYQFKKLTSDKVARKISYSKLYKPWNWVVGTGIYLDDIEQLVQSEIGHMKATLKTQQAYSYSVAVLTLLISLIILIRFEKQISRLIVEYEKKIKEFTDNLTKEKENTEQAMVALKSTQGQLIQSEKMAGLGVLVAGVAHEINNPINFVSLGIQNLHDDISQQKGFLLDLLQEEPEIIQELKQRYSRIDHSISDIGEGSQRIKGIVKDLRIFSRLDEADFKSVNIVDSVQSTLRIIQTQYKKNIEFKTDFQAQPELSCRPAKLNQVFMNIMTNACQAIKLRQQGENIKGCLIIRSFIRDISSGESLAIQFEDNGCGMIKDVREKMFDPFFTTKEVGEGTGLGMSITYSIIKEHQGEVDVQSTLGKGTCITLFFPLS